MTDDDSAGFRGAKPDLRGRVAVVTGGGRGIGAALAKRLASAGASVSLLGRTRSSLEETARAIEGSGGLALVLEADVTDPAAVRRAVRTAGERFGPIDLLVNNAGRGAAIGPTWELDPEDWWRDVEVNLRGVFLCCREVLPGMVARRAGRIINLTSEQGFVPSKYLSAYSCSKAAVLRLTDTLAAETLEHGLSVFAVSPGLVRTEMSEFVANSPAGRRWRPEVGPFLATWPHGPERAAELVVRLAAGFADALSGRFLSVNDDLALLVRHADEIRQKDLCVLRYRKPELSEP